MLIRSCARKKGRLAPALKHLGIECTLALGPGPFRLRGAGGLRNPSRESRPGPEATVLCIAGQIDPRLTEFRPHYDSIDEPVSPYRDTCATCRTVAKGNPTSPLAETCIRRDHQRVTAG